MGGAYDRLSALDNSFLVFEGHETHMHVGSVLTFEANPLRAEGGGLDIERIRAHIASRLHRMPRYRQRLAYVPIERRAVWVDDRQFNLHYHVRHTSLPRPGSERQLKRLAGMIMSQQLDRGKPLWEAWVVEGLEGTRVAIILKTHHCMTDGAGGVDLASVLLRPSPSRNLRAGPAWVPRPVPNRAKLLRDEFLYRSSVPLSLLRRIPRALSDPEDTLEMLRRRAVALAKTLGTGLHTASETPLNQPVGPHRRFDWLTMPIDELRDVGVRLGGTLSDVVLTTVAGALRRFLEGRRFNVDLLDMRALAPLDLHERRERGGAWIVDLPVAEPDPRRCFARVRRATAEMKESGQVTGVEMLTQATDWAPSTALTLAMRLTRSALPFNLVITDVPGPDSDLWLLGSRLLDSYPVAPLWVNQALGVALQVHTDRLAWGVNADWDRVPDLHEFILAIESSFRSLRESARSPASRPPKGRTGTRKRTPRRRGTRRTAGTS